MPDAPLPRRRIRGVLFDKDGTLFDFNATWAGVFAEIIGRLAPDAASAREMALLGGFDPDRRRFAPGSPLVAGATSEVAALWSRFRPDLTAGEIEATANAVAAATVRRDRLVPAAGDLPALLLALRARGLALGVATHDAEAAARAQLAAVGALDVFHFVAGYDSGHGLKPGTGMMRAFCQATGVAPAETVVVGDSLHDLHMGRSGGAALRVAVLTGPATAPDLEAEATHVIDSIEWLPALLDTVEAEAPPRGPNDG